MSVGPVYLNGMIQRTQDVGNLKQQDDNKPVVMQHNIEIHQKKQEEHVLHQVQQSQKKENEEFRYDAREKGSNSYEGSRQKKKEKKKEQESDGKVLLKNKSGSFDVKI